MHDPGSRETRPSLLLRIRDAEDWGSWSEFAKVYGPIIRGYCRRRGLQEADADDVGQEVLAQVARSIGTFEYEPGRGRFRDWLGVVTRHKIVRFLEIKGRGGPAIGLDVSAEGISSPGDDPEWLAEFHARILETALVRVRDDFEAGTWQAFEQIWLGELSAPEVASRRGMTIDAVYAAKSRVLKRLREEVLALADDLPSSWPPPNGRDLTHERLPIVGDPERLAPR